MKKNNFEYEYLKDLYETLDVSSRAKHRFFEAFLREAQNEANPGAKKASVINKFLAWVNKGTPTVESSTQTMLEALSGMERVIQTSPLLVEGNAQDDARRQGDIQYLNKFKTQIETATKGIVDADSKYKAAQDRFFQSNPNMQNAQNQLNQEAEAAQQELDELSNRIDTANGNPEELQNIKTELEQKLQEVKTQAGNDEDAGGEYEELIKKVDELLGEAGQNGEEGQGEGEQGAEGAEGGEPGAEGEQGAAEGEQQNGEAGETAEGGEPGTESQEAEGNAGASDANEAPAEGEAGAKPEGGEPANAEQPEEKPDEGKPEEKNALEQDKEKK